MGEYPFFLNFNATDKIRLSGDRRSKSAGNNLASEVVACTRPEEIAILIDFSAF